MNNIIQCILLITFCGPVFAQRTTRPWKTSLETSSFSYDYSGILLDYGLAFMNSKANDSQAVNTEYRRESHQQIFRLGFITNDRYFFGIGYATDQYQATDNGSINSAIENKSTMVGLGYYFKNNFYSHGYFVQQKNNVNNESYLGYRFDLGYKINLSEFLFMTAALSHQRTGPVWAVNPSLSLGLLLF